VQARAKGGSHAPIAFGDFRWQLNPTTKAKSSPGHSNSYVTFPWVVRDQIKEGQPAPLALGVAFGGWSWGDAYPSLDGTHLGRPRLCARDRREGGPHWPSTVFPQSPMSVKIQTLCGWRRNGRACFYQVARLRKSPPVFVRRTAKRALRSKCGRSGLGLRRAGLLGDL